MKMKIPGLCVLGMLMAGSSFASGPVICLNASYKLAESIAVGNRMNVESVVLDGEPGESESYLAKMSDDKGASKYRITMFADGAPGACVLTSAVLLKP